MEYLTEIGNYQITITREMLVINILIAFIVAMIAIFNIEKNIFKLITGVIMIKFATAIFFNMIFPISLYIFFVTDIICFILISVNLLWK